MVHISNTDEAISKSFHTVLQSVFPFCGDTFFSSNHPMDVHLFPYWQGTVFDVCRDVMSVYLPLKPVSIHLLQTFSETLKPIEEHLKDIHPVKIQSELCVHPSFENPIFSSSFHQWVKSRFMSGGIFQDMSHKDFLRNPKHFSYQTIYTDRETIIDYTHLMALRWESWHSSITIGLDPQKGWILMPTHGSAKEMEGLGILNPTAWLMMVAISCYLSGNMEQASRLWQAIVKNRASNPENTTPDEGGILTTNNYIRNIVTFLEK